MNIHIFLSRDSNRNKVFGATLALISITTALLVKHPLDKTFSGYDFVALVFRILSGIVTALLAWVFKVLILDQIDFRNFNFSLKFHFMKLVFKKVTTEKLTKAQMAFQAFALSLVFGLELFSFNF